MREWLLVGGGEGKDVSAVEGHSHPCREEGTEEVVKWALSLDSGIVFRDRVRVQRLYEWWKVGGEGKVGRWGGYGRKREEGYMRLKRGWVKGAMGHGECYTDSVGHAGELWARYCF